MNFVSIVIIFTCRNFSTNFSFKLCFFSLLFSDSLQNLFLYTLQSPPPPLVQYVYIPKTMINLFNKKMEFSFFYEKKNQAIVLVKHSNFSVFCIFLLRGNLVKNIVVHFLQDFYQ